MELLDSSTTLDQLKHLFRQDSLDGPIDLSVTLDGGQSWREYPVQGSTGEAMSITYSDPDHIWVFVLDGVAAGSEAVSIWKTSDGGIHWDKIIGVGLNNIGRFGDGGLPFGGDKTGMVFHDSTTGWVTLYQRQVTGQPFEPVLYVSHDGGQVWSRQPLAIPTSLGPIIFTRSDPPHFFSGGDGFLPVQFGTANRVMLQFYATHDGGNTWQPLMPLSFTNWPTSYDFSDLSYGWASDGTTLFRTNDGGNSWDRVTLVPSFGVNSRFDFVNSSVGWALDPTPDSKAATLYETADRGESWTRVDAFTDPQPCRFALGFKVIHDLIPSVIGGCLEDERHDGATGDGQQRTTKGSLVWRKAENYTAFTDGTRTWINGPFGLQSRLNAERFPWEMLTLDSLRNATYGGFGGEPPYTQTLTDGRYDESPGPLGGLYVHMNLEEKTVAFGDVYGDGGSGAVAIVALNLGGSGTSKHLEVLVNRQGQPNYVAGLYLGDRVKIKKIGIANGRITVDLLVQGPGVGLCCPNLAVTWKFRLQGDQLIEIH